MALVETASKMRIAAEAALDRGFSVFAVGPNSKIPRPGTHGHLDATALPADVDRLWDENPEYNPAISCAASGLIVFDYDEGNPPSEVCAIRTFKVKTARGQHIYFWGQMPGTKLYNSDGKKVGEIKSGDGYVLAAGARHPSGAIYAVLDDSPVAEAPAELIERLTKKPASEHKLIDDDGPILEGGRDVELMRLAGKYRRDGLEQDEIEAVLRRVNLHRCQPPLDDKDVARIAKSATRYEKDTATKLTIGGKDPETGIQVSAPPATLASAPTWNISVPYSEEIFYGLAGKIIRKLQPNTESHPVGNLLELLACFGNIVGPTAFYEIEDSRHFCNLFLVRVGKSSKSRKGTGRARIERIARSLDENWHSSRNTSGLGSGEIVVYEVRDPVIGTVRDKKTGQSRTEMTDPGVDDKRLYVSEGEFAGILAVAGRQDCLLSKVIRDAWDHKPIRNKVKSGSVVCQNPHISISADITREELHLQLKEADKFNGFGNRFLWCFVERQGLKPHGGDEIDWSEEIVELFKCVEFARKQRRVFMDRNAREMWNRIYEELSEDIAGTPGAVTSRAEAQVIRLALIFAMLDLSDHICVEHLKAARALWQYCEDSARVIFGGVMKSHQRILDFLKQWPKSATEVREVLFSKHRKVEEIKIDLSTLVALGRVYAKNDEAGVERFHLIGS